MTATNESTSSKNKNNVFARINFVRTVAENGGGFYGYQVSIPRSAQNDNDVFKMSFDNIELLQRGPRQSSWLKVDSDHEEQEIVQYERNETNVEYKFEKKAGKRARGGLGGRVQAHTRNSLMLEG